jgi:hypothetical protein
MPLLFMPDPFVKLVIEETPSKVDSIFVLPKNPGRVWVMLIVVGSPSAACAEKSEVLLMA